MNARTMILAVAGLAFLAAGADAQTLLRYKFTKGQTNTYEVVQSSKVTQTMPKLELGLKQTIDLTQTVDELLADGAAKVTWKLTRVRLSVTGPTTASVDSADPKEPEKTPGALAASLVPAVKALAKVEVTGKMSALGELSDLTVPEAVMKEIRDLPGSAKMGDMFSEQGIKNTISQIGFLAPKEAVKKDATWSRKNTTKHPFGVVNDEVKYTYEGVDLAGGKKLEKIAFTSNFAIDAKQDPIMTIKITDQKGGVVLFDNEAGRLQSLEIRPMEMTVSFLNGLEQTVTRTVSLTLK